MYLVSAGQLSSLYQISTVVIVAKALHYGASPLMPVEILHLEVEPRGEGWYRILVDGKRVKYLSIDGGIYDDDDMCFPPVLVDKLPPLPPGDWNVGHIGKSGDSEDPQFVKTEKKILNGVCQLWHPTTIDVLSLRQEKRIMSNVLVVTSDHFELPVIAKFARFEVEIPYYDHETEAYRWLQQQPGDSIGPRFLGHLAEEGRIIGFLLEKIEGHHAEPEDLSSCQDVLSKLHGVGILHGDVNKHKFLVSDSRTVLIDFECSSRTNDTDAKRRELASLPDELSSVSGKGGTVEYPPDMYEEMDIIYERDGGWSDELLRQALKGQITMTSEENKAMLRKQRGESP
ncbi:MAG: hypothetical protein M1837_007553 [Sclerophora amabilis]|nr:MAG: hypothetical protein M1837_007553 [Sclerophora amabilis]